MASKAQKRRRRVLGASCILAALIVAGSSFAWFTSKDEVTNKLSSSADYGVSIAESFQPPENWVPGQEVNKDAFATNTGNVDAFVRMYLEGNMRLLKQKKDSANANAKWDSSNSFGTIVGALTPVVDTNLLNANLTKLDANGNYFKTLDKTQTTNPNTSISTNNTGYAGNESGTNASTGPMSEVQSMQSGILAYAPSGAKYSYVLDQETELEVYLTSNENGADVTGYKKVQVPAGTLVIADETNTVRKAATLDTNYKLAPDTTSVTVTSTSGATKAYSSTVYIKQPTADFVPQNVEYESFTPMTDGLYLFLRNEENANQSDPEFSGYYVSGISTATPKDGTYYALNTGIAGTTGAAPTYRSDYTVKGATTADYDHPVQVTYDGAGTNAKNIIKVVPTDNLELFNAQYSDVASSNLKWYYDSTASKERMIALYDKDNDSEFDAADDIAVIINLANIDTTAAEKWTAINGSTSAAAAITNMKDYDAASGNITAIAMNGNPEYLKFYYNNDLESGDTTTKLVDKVKLYEGVKNTAYLAFDFDLKVKLDSVQVTYDENGNEADTAVKSGKGEAWKDTGTTGGATGVATVSDKEITSVEWTKTT